MTGDIFRPGCCAGKVVFVGGGSSGINLGIAQRFAELGASVALISRSQDRVSAAAETTAAAGATTRSELLRMCATMQRWTMPMGRRSGIMARSMS